MYSIQCIDVFRISDELSDCEVQQERSVPVDQWVEDSPVRELDEQVPKQGTQKEEGL